MFTHWPACLVLTLIIEANLRLFCLLWFEVNINSRCETGSAGVSFNTGSAAGAEEMDCWQFKVDTHGLGTIFKSLQVEQYDRMNLIFCLGANFDCKVKSDVSPQHTFKIMKSQ